MAHVFVDALDDTCTIAGRRGSSPPAGAPAARGRGRDGGRRHRPVASVTKCARSSAGELQLDATGAVRVEPELAPVVGLALALTKSGLEHVAARCTELGVDHIEPVRTERSVVRWDDARARKAVARLHTIVREAAAQCRRARLPEVRPVTSLAALAGRPGLVLADRDRPARRVLPGGRPRGVDRRRRPRRRADPRRDRTASDRRSRALRSRRTSFVPRPPQ